jgi:hypothetical protein
MARGGGEGHGLNRPARLWVTADDGRESSSCYGGSTAERTAGAADGPGVRRAHGAVRRRGRRGSRRLGQGELRGAWVSGSTCLGRRATSGGAWARTPRAANAPARHAARGRHDVVVQGALPPLSICWCCG